MRKRLPLYYSATSHSAPLFSFYSICMRSIAALMLSLAGAQLAVAEPGAGKEAMSTSEQRTEKECPSFLDHDYRLLHHTKTQSVCDVLEGDLLLVVNTASHCGFTPQFKELEALSEKYKTEGLTVVGFASDTFDQESKDEAEAAGICYRNFGVTFTMFAPTEVKGGNANPTFQHLNAASTEPEWNFNKYLVNLKTGDVAHFGSRTKPLNSALEKAISSTL